MTDKDTEIQTTDIQLGLKKNKEQRPPLSPHQSGRSSSEYLVFASALACSFVRYRFRFEIAKHILHSSADGCDPILHKCFFHNNEIIGAAADDPRKKYET